MIPAGASRLAVAGIGNTLAGDDGAGIRVLEALEALLGDERPPGVLLVRIEGDLLDVTDLLGEADHIIFLDAVAASPPGRLIRSVSARRAFAPSFHQTDIGTLMARLEPLGLVKVFPSWEIRGIAIDPPTILGEGLSPAVAEAAERLAGSLAREILAR
ncbi:MAG: hydrogenase maturation protease [Candidatus Fermentibacter sp.]|nr:hydrogenase maturation protease [Candidatus Fermentibacter sp.]